MQTLNVFISSQLYLFYFTVTSNLHHITISSLSYCSPGVLSAWSSPLRGQCRGQGPGPGHGDSNTGWPVCLRVRGGGHRWVGALIARSICVPVVFDGPVQRYVMSSDWLICNSSFSTLISPYLLQVGRRRLGDWWDRRGGAWLTTSWWWGSGLDRDIAVDPTGAGHETCDMWWYSLSSYW